MKGVLQMANQYTLTNDFAAISEESGTLYNKGDSAIELASTADTAKGAGIMLLTGERRTFNGTLYARSMDETGLLNVADFNDGGEGGESYLKYKGSVATYTDLPASPKVGDVYNIQAADEDHGILAGDNVAWNGTAWDRLAGVYAVMTGATASANGKAGLVPAPTAGQEKRVLTGAGAWEMPYGMRENSTAYSVGDVVFSSSLPLGLVLKCTTGGTTAATEPSFSGADIGDTVHDGTVTWAITRVLTTRDAGRRTRKPFTLATLEKAVAANNYLDFDILPGDYYKAAESGYTYIFAGGNPLKGTRSYTITNNHAGLIVQTHKTSKWNETNDTTGGYVSSVLHSYLVNTVLPKVKTDLGGDSHLYAHSKRYSTAINNTAYNRYGTATGCTNSWAWSADQYISALTEMQVYGGTVRSSSGYDTGEANQQLDVFKLFKFTDIFGNEYPWLRDVASAALAAYADYTGSASYAGASTAYCVAGLIAFH